MNVFSERQIVMARIRFATPEDAPAILDIYAYYIENTTVTFEYEVPTTEQFRARMERIYEIFPYLVYEEAGRVVAYAYASPQRERAAYGWNVELSVYVHERWRRKGIASRLYEVLLPILQKQGYRTAYACITHPHPQSEAFHHHFDFTDVAIFPHTGFKQGKWLDVIWMEKSLGDYCENPPCPRRITELQTEREWVFSD